MSTLGVVPRSVRFCCYCVVLENAATALAVGVPIQGKHHPGGRQHVVYSRLAFRRHLTLVHFSDLIRRTAAEVAHAMKSSRWWADVWNGVWRPTVAASGTGGPLTRPVRRCPLARCSAYSQHQQRFQLVGSWLHHNPLKE